jgi:MoaA/NifB/PqqE/SkfB family radical SAM enzyme
MRVTEKFRRSRLSLDDVKQILDKAAENDVRVVSFTGGEPLLLLDDLVAAINHAASAGIQYIRTGTNGFFFMNSGNGKGEAQIHKVAEKLADTQLRNFWISIDSSIPSVHEKMRGLPGVIRGIEEGLRVFHDHGIYPSANLGINRNVSEKTMETFGNPHSHDRDAYLESFFESFREGFTKFYRFVIDLGFTIVNSCYPMSSDQEQDSADFHAVYQAVSKDSVVRFTNPEKAMLFRAVLDTVPAFRSKIRVFSPCTSLYALHKQYLCGSNGSYPCRGGIDYFFINSQDANTYPCGYRGNESFGKYWEMDQDALNCNASCYECDWECFRDPSELFGPLLEGFATPGSLIRKFADDRRYLRLWINDVRYYRACDLFDGRKPPDYKRLSKF